MSFEPLDYLRHILVEVDYILATISGLMRRSGVHLSEASRSSAKRRRRCPTISERSIRTLNGEQWLACVTV